MKKNLLFLSMLLVAVVTLSKTEVVIVKVQTTALRTEPRFFAAVKLMLKAGDQLEKLGLREGWFQVKSASGAIGWVHSSAVEPRPTRLAVLSEGPQTKAAMSEVALASKGFNRQVETKYREKHPDLDYTWVDKMLGLRASSEALQKFLKEGMLGEWKEVK